MNYRGYRIIESDKGLEVHNVRNFNLEHTFECGQCFRWEREEDGSYTGIAYGKAINAALIDNVLYIKNTNIDDFLNIWFEYFDLGRDYGSIKEELIKIKHMENAVMFGSGIRILRQELWEVLISFILSTNSNIPRIRQNIKDLSKQLGEKILYAGKEYYAFPSKKTLAEAHIDSINICRGGYRCPYIKRTASMVQRNEVDLEAMGSLSAEDSIKEMCRLPGVGDKVASCALLFSGTKQDVFPVDVWIAKIMRKVFLRKDADAGEIKKFAERSFGPLRGFAQQYLFYYYRERRDTNIDRLGKY